MRTVKQIEDLAHKALQKYNDHVNNCALCQDLPIGEGVYSCPESEWLYEDYESLKSDADYADQVFQAELKERNPIKMSKK